MASLKEVGKRLTTVYPVMVDRLSGKAVAYTALAIHQAVVLATPVDTGKARSNWLLSVGEPILDEIEPYFPGEHLGIGETANAQAAIAQGKTAIQAAMGLLLGEQKPPVYITNNVRYITPLNEGHSTQALPGYVQEAIVTGKATASSALLDFS